MKKIKCNFYNYNKKTFDQVELDTNLKVYPCCTYYKKHMDGLVDKNDPFLKLDSSLKRRSIEDIIKSFNEIFNEEIWSNEKRCPLLCKDCGIVERDKTKCDFKI